MKWQILPQNSVSQLHCFCQSHDEIPSLDTMLMSISHLEWREYLFIDLVSICISFSVNYFAHFHYSFFSYWFVWSLKKVEISHLWWIVNIFPICHVFALVHSVFLTMWKIVVCEVVYQSSVHSSWCCVTTTVLDHFFQIITIFL